MAQQISIFMMNGIPELPLEDANLYNYFSRGIFLANSVDTLCHLAGGATDPSRPNETEAETGARVLRERLHIPERLISAHPQGIDAREVLEHHARNIPTGSPITIFCAWTHQDLVRFHALRLFGERAQVVPLAFPTDVQSESAQAWRVRLKRVPRTLLGIAGVYIPLARAVELLLRRRHMREMASRPSS